MTAQKKTAAKSSGNVKIKWVVSFIGCTDDMRQTIRGLGLRRLHQVVERQDTPAVRGVSQKGRHLVEGVEWGHGGKSCKPCAQAPPAQAGHSGIERAPLVHALE